MARNNVRLINYHTSGITAPQITDMAVGEIAVGKDLIWSKHKENEELSVFISSGAVHSAISVATTEIKGITDSLSQKITANTEKFDEYATSANTVAADKKVLSSAKTYTDTLKGSGYTNETLAGLKSEINSLKGDSDTTVGAVASRVTTIEEILGKTDKEGLRKDVVDLKTTVGDSTTGLVKDVADLKTKDTDLNKKIDAVSGSSSAYTDSQINAIKGTSYTEGTTLASLKSNLKTEQIRIDEILQDAPTDLKSFKEVDTKIKTSISSVYKVKGSCTYAELLKESGQTEGDVWNVTDAHDNVPAGTNYVWAKGKGETTAKWDALGGTIDLSPYATTATTNGLESRLGHAEKNINTLTAATGTLNTSITTIQGWKINGTAITSDTVLNGNNLKVDATVGAKTLKEAIAEAASSGSDANNAFTAWTAGTYTQNKKDTDGKLDKIDAYTVNGLKISETPVLTGENVKVSTSTTAQSLNEAIADAKAAGTAASNAVDTLRGGYKGTIKSINDSVTANTSNITQLKTNVEDISDKANSAVQAITVTNTGTNGITARKTGTNVTFNFDNMVIDCGEF